MAKGGRKIERGPGFQLEVPATVPGTARPVRPEEPRLGARVVWKVPLRLLGWSGCRLQGLGSSGGPVREKSPHADPQAPRFRGTQHPGSQSGLCARDSAERSTQPEPRRTRLQDRAEDHDPRE